MSLDLPAIRALLQDLPVADGRAVAAAAARQGRLTKPAGSLGRLEEIAIWLAGWQEQSQPRADRIRAVVFAGNHGVAARGVSAFPAEVTEQMVANFRRGGAAINQLCRLHGAELGVVALDLDRPTADFTRGPAMTEAEFGAAVAAGFAAAEAPADLLVIGEMGIANTTAAAAIAAAIVGGPAADWCGAGTGVDSAGRARKADAVTAALQCHGEALADPLEVLRRLGGREIAAMFGALLGARRRRLPVLLDGYVVAAAALVLHAAAPGGLDHCIAGHRSVEPGHGRLLDRFGMVPLLDLGMRLGEGSGAAVAVGVVRAAVACHDGMATFDEAGVSDRD